MDSEFGAEEKNRYRQQEFFADIGAQGLQKLKNSRVLILGCGALGSMTASLLARAGVGFLRLADRDYLRLEHLYDHTLFEEHTVKEGLPKAFAAAEKIRQINGTITIEPVVNDVNRQNILPLICDVDLIICCVNNWETASLVNEAGVDQNRSFICGFFSATSGFCLNVIPGKTACLKCVSDCYPDFFDSLDSNQSGNLNSICCSIAGGLCTESIKFLTENINLLEKQLVKIDLWNSTFEKINITKSEIQKNCPVCNNREFNLLAGKYGSVFIKPIAPDRIQLVPFSENQIDLAALAIKLSDEGMVRANDFLVIFETGKYELTIFSDGRVIVRGTTDAGIARELCSTYVKF